MRNNTKITLFPACFFAHLVSCLGSFPIKHSWIFWGGRSQGYTDPLANNLPHASLIWTLLPTPELNIREHSCISWRAKRGLIEHELFLFEQSGKISKIPTISLCDKRKRWEQDPNALHNGETENGHPLILYFISRCRSIVANHSAIEL